MSVQNIQKFSNFMRLFFVPFVMFFSNFGSTFCCDLDRNKYEQRIGIGPKIENQEFSYTELNSDWYHLIHYNGSKRESIHWCIKQRNQITYFIPRYILIHSTIVPWEKHVTNIKRVDILTLSTMQESDNWNCAFWMYSIALV